MKTILKIAKTELQVLFYSPVAWIILVIFSFQTGMLLAGNFDGMVRVQSMHYPLVDATYNTFASAFNGVFVKIQGYLYLYIPLLTMSIMSREFSSGSIKLLYSSPLTNTQIIMGKYVSLMLYGLMLMAVPAFHIVFSAFTIEHADIPYMITAWLGLYLLLCGYAAIGLFMSSLTSYNIVAALGTLCVLALLNYAKGLWQDVAFVRDITYWLGMNGRSGVFVEGMITTEDLCYFIIVVLLFLAFTIIRLQAGRQKKPFWQTFGKYAGAFVIAALLGYVTTLPTVKKYYDATNNKKNTLTKASQEVMRKLDGGFTIHTYVNMLDDNYWIGMPGSYKDDIKRFESYIRFKPEMKVDYTYYYHGTGSERMTRNPGLAKLNPDELLDTMRKMNKWDFDIAPYSAISKQVDLAPEGFRFVRVLERKNGKKTFLRIYNDMMRLPSEAETSAAIKRLVMDLPVVGFLKGQGERESNSPQDRGYNMIAQEKTFRYALINQGFDFADVTLDKDISASIKILVIAEPRKAFTEQEIGYLKNYMANGGNLIVAAEPANGSYLQPVLQELGISLVPGTLVKPNPKFQPDLMLITPTKAATTFSFYLDQMKKREFLLSMPGATGLQFDPARGFKATTLFQTDSTGSWNETETTNFIDDSVRVNAAAGEKEQPYPTVLALSRHVKGKEQKVLVTGDADWMSNGELAMSRNDVRTSNFSLISAAFYWLSDNEVPIDMRLDESPDKALSMGEKAWTFWSIAIKWGIPVLLLLSGVLIWIRRRGR